MYISSNHTLFWIFLVLLTNVMSALRIVTRRLLSSQRLLLQRATLTATIQRLTPLTYSTPVYRTFATESPNGEVKRFEADTKKLLDIVAKSLYSDKEVGLMHYA